MHETLVLLDSLPLGGSYERSGKNTFEHNVRFARLAFKSYFANFDGHTCFLLFSFSLSELISTTSVMLFFLDWALLSNGKKKKTDEDLFWCRYIIIKRQ